jgi:5S rRNA maturation endonuclease (ribonuclease M5)
MPSIRSYSAEENLRRIRMQKKLNFVVVEGPDDIPIYESFLESLNVKNNFEVIFSGGKTAIKDFIKNHKSKNSIFIVDRDFDKNEINDERVVYLNRYSIENYFICEEVISAALSLVFKCKKQDAKNIFSLDEYRKEISHSIETLTKSLYYYQNIIAPQKVDEEKIAWSDMFICENNSWKICKKKVIQLIKTLIPDDEDQDKAKSEFEKKYTANVDFLYIFPGKMLKTSLQRYIQLKIKEVKPSARSHFGDIEAMRIALASKMHYSTDLKTTLEPVNAFLNQ